MNAEQKAKWVEALRSGRFKQCESRLREYEFVGDEEPGKVIGYCCLGVADEVLELYSNDKEMLAKRGLKTAGEEEDYIFLPRKVQIQLTELNDGRSANPGAGIEAIPQHSFAEIADFIEREVECTE